MAIALKTIESNSYTFGLYLPTLFGLKINLQALIDKNLVFECISLVHALQAGMEKRFGELMNPFASDKKSVPLFVAMLTNPRYKFNFMGLSSIPPNLFNHFKKMLFSEARNMLNDNKDSNGNFPVENSNIINVNGNRF